MKLITKILSRFQKSSPPTLKEAVAKANKITSDLDDLMFYLSLLTDHKVTTVQADYLNKAAFNLSSARDELQISYNERRDKAFMEARIGITRH